MYVTPEPDSEVQQQHLSPALVDDRASQGILAKLAAKGLRTPLSLSSLMSFSDAPNKAKAFAETEKSWEGDASCA